MDVFERLRSSAAEDWTRYVDHPFVRQLGDGTLPEAAFRAYLVQDYLFLIQFARAYALAAYKSRTPGDIRAAQAGLASILDETELHVRLCARWGIGVEALAATREHPATVAYTRFVLDQGAAGDLLDLHVALAPCVVGYAVIGKALAPQGPEALGDHPYREWIADYAGEGYQGVARPRPGASGRPRRADAHGGPVPGPRRDLRRRLAPRSGFLADGSRRGEGLTRHARASRAARRW